MLTLRLWCIILGAMVIVCALEWWMVSTMSPDRLSTIFRWMLFSIVVLCVCHVNLSKIKSAIGSFFYSDPTE